MLIGIEASRANRLQKTGVEWYAYHLIQHLKKLPEAQNHSWLLYGNEPLASGLEKGPANWHEARLPWPPKYLWTQMRLSWEMMRRKPDVLFVPAHVLPRVHPARTVVTIHDIGFHRYADLYPRRQRLYHEQTTREIVRRAARIITVSQFSKQEIIGAYDADPEKIFVTSLGIDHHRYRRADETVRAAVLSRFGLSSPFLMYVGRLEKKKNVDTIVDAFYRYKKWRGVGDPLSLVLVGQPGAGWADLEKKITESVFCDSVKVIGYVNEEEKIALLSSATALVHPSWYEGFGLTPLEAMACGCPVICSHAASLPEVVGLENALWFDPADADALVRQLVVLTSDPQVARHLAERGASWVKRYDWTETARQTLPLLTEW